MSSTPESFTDWLEDKRALDVTVTFDLPNGEIDWRYLDDLGGPPWRCPNCNRLNTNDRKKCKQCEHEQSGCTDYLQHPWESCPENEASGG